MPGTALRPGQLRVAVVVPTHWCYRMGGSQYQAKLLIRELHARYGAEIAYFTARAGNERQFADHRVVCVGNTNALRRFGHFWDYFRLQKALKEFAPHVIYQRVGCAYTGIAATYARRSGVPMVWHLASHKDSQKAPPLSRLLRRPHAILETRLRQRGAVLADVIVAQSEDQARKLNESFGRKADRLIRNFHAVPPVAEKHAGRLTALWIGNLKAIKRPELLFEIASRLNGCPEVEILIVGRPYASEPLKRRFDALLRDHPNVRYVGGMPQDKVNELLAASDLLINTSESEGFSNTFIQAWMRSVPVYTLGVNPDGLLTDSLLGCSYDSPTDLADAVRGLVANSDMLAQMGQESREYAVRHFSMDNAAELAELIIETAEKTRGKPEHRREKLT